MKNIRVFYLKIFWVFFFFFQVKCSIYLNRRVFVMKSLSALLSSVVYILWYFVVIESILNFLKIYMKVIDVAYW